MDVTLGTPNWERFWITRSFPSTGFYVIVLSYFVTFFCTTNVPSWKVVRDAMS